jgi:hypothetical protein
VSRRWSEEDLARYLHKDQPAPLSEAAFQQAVIRLAKDAGYSFTYHVFDSRRSVWGFPDLVLVHREPGHPLYMVELKTDTGQVTAAQAAWLEALAGCTGVVAEIWRPADLDAIVQRLRG